MVSPAARIIDMDDLAESIGDDLEFTLISPFIGSPISGDIMLCAHTCPRCEASLETSGAGHPRVICSSCEFSGRGSIEMQRKFVSLEVE